MNHTSFIFRRTLSVWLVLLSCMMACSRNSSDAEFHRRQQALYTLGTQLRDAIVQQDARKVAALVFPAKRDWNDVELGEDFKYPAAEFLEEFRVKRGYAYARTFDTAQYREFWGAGELGILERGTFTADNIFSVRDHLLHAGKTLEIHIEVEPESPGIPMFGVVHYDWPDKSHTEFTDPHFIYTKLGWRLTTYFGFQ